jgi:hypothetical protein
VNNRLAVQLPTVSRKKSSLPVLSGQGRTLDASRQSIRRLKVTWAMLSKGTLAIVGGHTAMLWASKAVTVRPVASLAKTISLSDGGT